ncbi:MAG: GH25 family lysozyme [Coriobacteriia bacterium]|nr:GH25 family lysozyme [Coriobacteriia bacterium]
MLLALLAVLVAGVMLLSSCFFSHGGSGGSGWTPPYCDPEGFSWENGRMSYAEDGEIVSKIGIDVSDHQDYIDWDAVAADGIEFAFIREGYRGSSEGDLFQDDYFEYNLQFARAAGIECGVYFFSQAISEEEAREEAEFVLQLLAGAELDYPVVFDYEQNAAGIDSRIEGMSREESTAIALAFCETIKAGGYEAMLYGNGYDLANYDLDELEDYGLWYAEYGDYPSCRRPFAVWQYSNDGRVAGIETAIDMNLDIRGV